MTPAGPASVPDGLVVELSRTKVLPGASDEADRWMAMLNGRHDECVATLDRERMAIEIVFRLKENGEDYPFWVSVPGPDGQPFDPSSAIDRDHLEQAKRTKLPGWTEAEPQLLLLPDPVRDAVLSWARHGPQLPAAPAGPHGRMGRMAAWARTHGRMGRLERSLAGSGLVREL